VDNFYLSALVREVAPQVQGRSVFRVSLQDSTIFIDLRLEDRHQLLVSLDRSSPGLYISNRLAPARKDSSNPFITLLRKHIVGARLIEFRKDPLDRIVNLAFEKLDAGDNRVRVSLRLALTGRSANAVLTDSEGTVLGELFESLSVEGRLQPTPSSETLNQAELDIKISDSMTQPEVLARYFGPGSGFGPRLKDEFLTRCKRATPAAAFRSLVKDLVDNDPQPLVYSRVPLDEIDRVLINPKMELLLSHFELAQASELMRFRFSSLSEAADEYYIARSRALALRAEYDSLKQLLTRQINKREAALKAIDSDRRRFEHPEQMKRYGELLLANLSSAQVDQSSVTVIDYYDPDQTRIKIEIPDGATLKKAASDYFARYQKSRRALAAIESREREVSQGLDPLKQFLQRLEREATASSIAEVRKSAERLLGIARRAPLDKEKRTRGKSSSVPGRRFRSSDGYEIVVGRNDRDNDVLTFRVARPHDIWLHAADYPGSHAIIRNPTRDASPPQRTIAEAAELAAFYSQAKREGKAAVHYAQKKFVSKPPRSKPGLVRLSSFKTILVAPRCILERLK